MESPALSKSMSRWESFKSYFMMQTNVLVSCLITAVFSFQVGVYQAKHKVFEPYQEKIVTTNKLQSKINDFVKVEEKQKELQKQLADVSPSRVVNVKPFYLLLEHPDGRYEQRTGGTLPWRHNNPGKLLYGSFAKAQGAIGRDGPLAIFATYEDGRKALQEYLFNSEFGFSHLTLTAAIKKFAPAGDGYSPDTYARFVTKDSKISGGKKLSTMSSDEIGKVLDSIQVFEDFIPGNKFEYDNKKDWEIKGW